MKLNRLFLLLCVLLGGLLSAGCGGGSGVTDTLLGSVGLGPKRSVKPEDFGAIGDGITDDTLAMRAAIASLQDLNLTTGKTYLVSGTLKLNPSQTIYGNSATIKNVDQPAVITTNTPITAGVTKQIVTNTAPTALKVGMSIAFSKGPQANLTIQQNLSTAADITAIDLNTKTITLATPITASFTGATDIHVTFSTLLLADDCKVFDLKMDGNRANWTWSRWEVTHEILMFGNRGSIQRCMIDGAPGEGILISKSNNVVRDTVLTNLNGNGVHMSGSTITTCDNVTVTNPNAVVAVGHQNGCIISSSQVQETHVLNCHLTGGFAGIANFATLDSSNTTFINNVIRNCSLYGIQVGAASENHLISGNRIYNCGTGANGGIYVSALSQGRMIFENNFLSASSVQITSSTTSRPVGFQFTGNRIENGDLSLGSLDNSKVSNNVILQGVINAKSVCNNLDISDNTIDNTGNATRIGIYISGIGITGVTLDHNTIVGGDTGIRYGELSQNLAQITQNQCTQQNNLGIYISGNYDLKSCVIRGNLISNSPTASSGWMGIRIEGQNVFANQNTITQVADNTHAQFGIRVINSGTGDILDGNILRGPFRIAPIFINPTCVGVVVQNNNMQGLIVNQGVGTVLVNNIQTP